VTIRHLTTFILPVAVAELLSHPDYMQITLLTKAVSFLSVQSVTLEIKISLNC